MTCFRWMSAPCTALLLLILAVESLPAQEELVMRPNLRDRTLAPNKAFDLGRYFRPERDRRAAADIPAMTLAAARGTAAGIQGALQSEEFAPDVEALTASSELVQALDEVLETPDAALLRAVDAYNRLVVTGPEGLFRDGAADIRPLRWALLELTGGALPGAGTSAPVGHSRGSPDEWGADPSLDGGDPGEGTSADRTPGPAVETAQRLRASYLIERPSGLQAQAPGRWEIPGMVASNPHAFGAQFGQFWASASAQPHVRRQSGDPGGAVGVGFGLGDSDRYLGLHVAAMSFTTRSGFGDRGAVDVQIHRTFEGIVSLAVGWESAHHWGGDFTENDSGSNRYGVASVWVNLGPEDEPFSAMMISAGMGDGRFQSERAFLRGTDKVGFFGSIGVRVWPPGSLIVEWTGQDLQVATSVTPLKDRRFAVLAGITDVTGNAGDGVRFFMGGSAAYDFVWR